jgi:hypothetical protein
MKNIIKLCIYLVIVLFNFYRCSSNNSINGTWVENRHSYGTDTLIITDTSYYFNFVYQKAQRKITGQIVNSEPDLGRMKIRYLNIQQGDKKDTIKTEFIFIKYSCIDDELRIVNNVLNYPDDKLLEENATRSTFKRLK